MPKPLPVFSQMPWHVQQNIVNKANHETKLTLRQCSKNLNAFVKKSTMSYDGLNLRWENDKQCIRVCLIFSGEVLTVEFQSQNDGFLKKTKSDSRGNYDTEKFVENQNYMDGAVEQFVKVLKEYPRVHLGRLFVSFDSYTEEERYNDRKEELMEKLVTALQNLKKKLVVREFDMYNDRNGTDILRILTFLTPGVLKTIAFFPSVAASAWNRYHDIDLSEIAETEQWRQAKVLYLARYHLTVPREKTAHFSKISYSTPNFYLEDAIYFLENIFNKHWHTRVLHCVTMDYIGILQHLKPFKFKRHNRSKEFKIRKGDDVCYVFVCSNRKQISFSKNSHRVHYAGAL